MDALRGKQGSALSSLPDDVELLDIKYDLFSGEVQAVVRSASFNDAAESYPIPEFNVKYAAPAKIVAKSAAIAETKPSPIVKTQPSPAQDSSLTEEEFTPDQRKLLSFKVEDDFVIVKPIQYLKSEWDDINDVVRSLGGRWIKGDIISYWKIPLRQT